MNEALSGYLDEFVQRYLDNIIFERQIPVLLGSIDISEKEPMFYQRDETPEKDNRWRKQKI